MKVREKISKLLKCFWKNQGASNTSNALLILGRGTSNKGGGACNMGEASFIGGLRNYLFSDAVFTPKCLA